MGIRYYKPTTPSRRHASVLDFSVLTDKEPEKRLVVRLPRTGGRNNQGTITSRFRGGGHKRLYRLIDFKRQKDDIDARVVALEYDPNRTAFIALLCYADGEKRYILAPKGLQVGDRVRSGQVCEPKVGNCMPLRSIPVGMAIHNIELTPGRGGKIVRSAGAAATLTAKEGNYAHVLLPSGEVRMIHVACRATIGQVSNVEHGMIRLGKAGRNRWRGRRPHNRGKSMNPVDHPLGGGEGRTGEGRPPKTPWGKNARGGRTRAPRKPSSRFIVRNRKHGKGGA